MEERVKHQDAVITEFTLAAKAESNQLKELENRNFHLNKDLE